MVCFETVALYIRKIKVLDVKISLVLLFIYFYETGSYCAARGGEEFTEIFLPLSAVRWG